MNENEEYAKLKKSNNKKSAIIGILVFLIIVIGALGLYFIYQKEKGKPTDKETTINETPTVTDNENLNIVLNNSITSLNRIEITDENQVAIIANKEYKIRKEVTVDGAFLLINDEAIELSNGDTVFAEYAYVTNNSIIFTVNAQDWESITYAINGDGKVIKVTDNEYQIHDLNINDGKLLCKGHIFCGIDGNCPDIDLVIVHSNDEIMVIANK